MTEAIPELIDKMEDLIVTIRLPDMSVVHLNTNLRQMLGIPTSDETKRTFPELVGLHFDEMKRSELLGSLESTGIAAISDVSEKFSFYLIRPATSPDLCIVRVLPKSRISTLQRYKGLIENNVAGIFQSTIDSVLLDCNQAFAEMLGYESRNELIGTTTKQLYFDRTDRAEFIRDLRAKIKLTNYQITLKRKDGLPIECLENTYLSLDEKGDEVINGTIVDITARLGAERALSESERRLAALAAVSHESVIFVQDEIIVDCNEQFASLFGFSRRSEVISSALSDFIPGNDISRLFIAMDVSRSNRTEIRAIIRDGNSLVLEASGTYLEFRNHTVRVFVLADITARKRSENALEQTVMRLRNVLEHAPNSIFITIEGEIRYTNQSGLDLFRVEDEDDLIGRPMVDLVCEPFRDEIGKDFEIVAGGGEQHYKEIRVSAGNEEVDVGIQSTLTVFDNKPAVQISMTDIGERLTLVKEQMRLRIVEEINVVLKKEIEEHKITQDKLRAQEQYSRSLIESSMDMIVACDKDFLLTEFNRSAQTQFGFKRKDVLGEHMKLLYAKEDQYVLMHAELIQGGEYFGEVTNLRSNGEQFQSLVSFSVIRDGKGEASGYMAIFRDITEYRANERKALEQKAKLESIFNSTENMFMWTMDRSFRLTTQNLNFQQWIKEHLNEPLALGENVMTILESICDENFYQGQLTAFEYAFGGRPQQFELAVLTRQKERVWLQFFINPVHTEGVPEEVSCLVYDTTERKIIERKVREALKEKEVLLQEIHHRVKNNLQVISSILNLQSSYVSDERILDILRESQNRIKSMSFIHETLYRTSDFSSINFSEYLRTLSHNLIQTYAINRHSIVFRPDLEEVSVHIDQAIPCGLIVNELVSNALKYAFDGSDKGHLDLGLYTDGSRLTLRVADDGVGLPEGFQYEKTDSLGIQLVYTLTEQLDGSLSVNSQPGSGTEFIITFELINSADRRE